MKIPWWTMIIIIAGLSSGNFFFQFFIPATPDYMLAFERSFFQAIGIFTYWIFLRTGPKE